MDLETISSSPIFIKVLVSFTIIVAGMVLRYLLKVALNRHLSRFIRKAPQKVFFNKIIKAIIYVIVMISVLAIWVKDPWSLLVGMVAVISVGFFAVWSILSNLLAGILILTTRPFQVGDKISLLPEDIVGVVSDYDFFFIEMKDEHGAVIFIPNNMVFQKIVKKFPKH